MTNFDKLADVIRWGYEEGTWSRATAAVRERFIVIDRDDLPDVERVWMRSEHTGTFRFKDSLLERVNYDDDHLLLARAHLAAAEYLRENPPVDEAAVKELAEYIEGDPGWGEDGSAATIARRLVMVGWRRETTP
jgi:hypothetical protein